MKDTRPQRGSANGATLVPTRASQLYAMLADRAWTLRSIASHRLRYLPVVGRSYAALSDRLFRRRFVTDLQLLNDTLARHAMSGRYWMWAGVLLGWAREGAPLAHDRDADFALLPEDFTRLVELAPDLRAAGFTPFHQFRNNAGTLTEVTFRRHGARFEFFLFRPDDGELTFFLYGWPPRHLLEIEARVMDQERVPFDFLDREWLRARDVESELTALYGDWRRPEPQWSYLNDVRATVTRRPWTNPDTCWRDDARLPGPIRLVSADRGEPWPDLVADEHYRDAWVVVSDAGVPRTIVEVALSDDPTSTHPRLEDATRHLSRRPEGGPERDLPTISVVVPTIATRLDELEGCLVSLEDLDYPSVDIVLVDNRHDVPTPDPLEDLLARHQHVRATRATRPGISAARNVGVRESTGDVIAFTDDDVRVDRQWLRAIGERFARESDTDALSGLVLPAELETPAQIYYERYFGGFGGPRTFEPRHLVADEPGRWCLGRGHFLAFDDEGHEVRRASLYGVGAYVAGANMAFRRGALARIGGFDEDLGTGTASRGGEDLYAFITLLARGGRVTYEPAAVVRHRHRASYEDLETQMDASGVGFGAMLSALVVSDPCHLVRLTSQVVVASTQTLRRARRRGFSPARGETSQDAPPELFWREVRGYLRGPSAYAASRRSR